MSTPRRAVEIEALFDTANARAFSCQVTPDLIDQLLDEERVALAPMVAARRAEFATARACARAAMAALGIEGPIPRRNGGSPQWPDGVAGSISHTRGYCLGVSTLEPVSIGIDAEEIARIRPAVERRILGDAECSRLVGLDDDDRQRTVATIFAAKEAFYKAHYEVDARYLGFDAVTVDFDGDGCVNFVPDSGAVGELVLKRASGRVLVDAGRVVVGVTIDRSDFAAALPSPS